MQSCMISCHVLPFGLARRCDYKCAFMSVVKSPGKEQAVSWSNGWAIMRIRFAVCHLVANNHHKGALYGVLWGSQPNMMCRGAHPAQLAVVLSALTWCPLMLIL